MQAELVEPKTTTTLHEDQRVIGLPTFRRAIWALSIATVHLFSGCDTAGTTAPAPNVPTRVVVAAATASLYEQDVVTLSATVLNADGDVIPGAPVTWSLSDPARGELAQNTLTLLNAGELSVTARSGSVTGSQTFTVLRSPVVDVTVGLPSGVLLRRGDISPLGVRVGGVGGRLLTGRSVQLTSDDPSIALIDPAGRVRAVAAGIATVRATAEGVSGILRVEVAAEDVVLHLSHLGTQRLPVRVDAFDVGSGNGIIQYEVWMERGDLMLTTLAPARYAVQVGFTTYQVTTVNGQRSLQPVGTTREYDHGVVEYDARGDLVMTSERIGPLRHTATPLSGGFRMAFRVPGDDLVYDLFYRREPE